MVMVMMVMMMIGPVLRAGRTHAEGREAQWRYCIRHSRLEEALPSLTAVVTHLRLFAGLLQALLRGVAYVIALVNVVDVARVIRHLEDEVLGVFLRYHGGRWHELLTG